MRVLESTLPAVPVVGFVGSSGSGKTTLIAALLPLLSRRGLRIAVLKHAHQGFDIDKPGKDSHRAREAGAVQVLVASRDRWVLMVEESARGLSEPPFEELMARFDPRQVDLVLAEGFSGESYPKIEVYRATHGQPPKCWPADPHLIALATDSSPADSGGVALLDLNNHQAVAEFVERQMRRIETPPELSLSA